MNTRKDRLQEVFDYLRNRAFVHTKKDFALKVGQTLPAMYSAFGGNADYLTDSLMRRICQSFPNIFNLDWLLKGEGEMLQDSKNELEPQPIDHSSLVNALIAAKDETIATLRQQLTILQQQLEDKDTIIRLLRSNYNSINQPLDNAAENIN